MGPVVSDVAFTPSVKAVQERLGSRNRYARMDREHGWSNEITPELVGFLSECDSFYLGTSNSEGQPYIQHRGGPRGFLKMLDRKTLAFADFAGNRQYISLGNLAENDRAFIFVMQYSHQRRMKIWGRAQVVEWSAAWETLLANSDYKAKPERAIVFRVEAWDVNCPAHIVRRFDDAHVALQIAAARRRIAELENENQSLWKRLNDVGKIS